MTEPSFFNALVEKVRAELKNAMRERDEVRATTLKGILAAFANESVALGRTPQSPLSAVEAQKVLRRLIKQREEAKEIYEQQGRAELALREAQEAEILARFLPPELSEGEVRQIVQKIQAQNPTTKSGALIGLVMREVAGRADGALVRRVVEEETRAS
ncbi:GatB/YqeY domain-containing protein [Candidatus Parcubacteria bacterium]|jgi:uncharacterized protein YqeY|nr:MAG: GatB/YqeY domain-containing protein [Candidatus Parcubacteria bacterium]GIW68953.1 MAG: aspartyl-tRNA amidotransferase subunit B [Candidatus Parcubacteria bacterium]